ncbi:MAG: hypothetical protein WKF89_05005 [Chitinophagaceae bacterium]
MIYYLFRSRASEAKMSILSIIVFCFQQASYSNPIGNWSWSKQGLPIYQYKGPLPFKGVDKNGKDAMQPEDPYFLIGNYRMALVTHASGVYQFLTAERAWARLNGSEQINYGWNDASIVFQNDPLGKKVVLTGVKSIAADQALVTKNSD